MTTEKSRQGRVVLTPKQEAAMRFFITHGELNEGLMHETWPLIRNPRLITNGLLAKDLVVLGEWWDEAGYDLKITTLGARVLLDLHGSTAEKG